MNALRSLLFSALAALGLALGGCADSQARHEAAEETAATYKAGHGLQLSPAAAKFAGVETAAFNGQLPAAALLRTIKGDFVFVDNGGWLLRTEVKLGAASPGGYELKEGLYDGDTIATAGVRALWLAELQAVNGGVGCADGH